MLSIITGSNLTIFVFGLLLGVALGGYLSYTKISRKPASRKKSSNKTTTKKKSTKKK